MDPSVDPTLPHDNGAHILIGVVCLVCGIATIAVGLRFYTRSLIIGQIGADDYLVLIAWMLAIATGVAQCANTRDGLGKHIWDLNGPEDVSRYLKGFFLSIVFYNACLLFAKLTFLAQYYRVLTIKRMQIVLTVAMLVIGSWSVSQLFLAIFLCNPVAGFWDTSVNARCIPTPLEWYINATGNIVTDIVIFILPMPVLGHLNLPKAQRVMLIGIFSLGFFTCAISAIRIKYLKQGGDFTYENIGGSSWSITELCSGVTCACLPTLRPLASKWMPALSTRLHKSSRGYRRQSCSHVTDVEMGGGKHTRVGSKESNNLKFMATRRDFGHPYALGMHLGDSEVTSDGILGIKSRRDGPQSPKASPPRPLKSAHFAADEACSSLVRDTWPTVTTKIGVSRSPGPDSDKNQPSWAIRVKRDVVMEDWSYPEKH
ncbi:hypothetical protein F4809DRAFT_637690 [Biscogniauxia mediterranea]|nr:hypothetical protein F4809DRAFT_637690 [Biscogniauxia mediterranea]